MISNENLAQKAHFFECIFCTFKCVRKSDYNRHILTRKHQKSINGNDLAIKKAQKAQYEKEYKCENCEKIYKDYSGLWRHNKKFDDKVDKANNENNNIENEENTQQIQNEDKQMICKLIQQNMELITQNKEFKDLIIELASKTNVVNNNFNNTTNNTNKFNMNIFLNETCKDALNIMDFVTSLPLSLQDLEETGKQGYVKGLSRILVNGLKDIDVSKRPIHCSDLKRETLYIKDNNVWEKEDPERTRIKNAIKYISLKNAKQITQWTKVKENEGYKDSYNKKSDQYLKLVYEANGGDDDELNKIIKNITPNVTIDKTEI